MRLLLLNHNTRGQGTYWRALQFARQFHMRGHEVTLMCVAADKRFRARRSSRDGFTLFETPHWAPGLDPQEGWGPLDVLFRTARGLARRVDLVFSFDHKPDAIIPAKAARLRSGCPWISDWCDWWGGPEGLFRRWVIPGEGFQALPARVRRWREWIFRRDERREERARLSADLMTVICQALADRAESLGTRRDRILLLPSGAPADAIQPGDKSSARAALDLPGGAFVLGYMANAHLDEDLLLGAFARLLDAAPETVLLVLGPPFDHPERHLTPRQRTRSVRALGPVPFPRIGSVLAAADVLLMPLSDCLYNRGRWPNKIGDYLAAGRPIVTTNVGDAPALVSRHGIGWVGSPTSESLARAIAQAWDDRAQWEDLGRQARRVAETELSWHALAEKLITAIHVRLGLDLSR
ncbi:MAG: glycosyltransferase family 4 protein [Candidatus Sumerlaeia bacterium]|nr:glycosyltransferase family 4 protein [Candidatus Sumerlaeia bacterium]